MIIAVVGAKGKFGSAIVQELHALNHTVLEIEKDDNIKKLDLSSADVCIDASIHTNTNRVAKACKKTSLALLVVCTGHSNRELAHIKKLCTNLPLEFCPNTSLGMSLITDFLSGATIPGTTKACIFEEHHTQKLDLPSGTALMLKTLLESKLDSPVCVTSSRLEGAIGTHKITLDLDGETLEITHTLKSRSALAKGAVQKAINLKNREELPNVMPDIIGEIHDQN